MCGSRDWTDENAIGDRLSRLGHEVGWHCTIVHGAARGADRIAAEIALSLGFRVEDHPADWPRYGRRAGFLRNVQMLSTGIGLVLAFQRGGSRGTQHTIDEARKRGIPVEVFTA